jgi:trehalose/maltose transport system substrate-binding protein
MAASHRPDRRVRDRGPKRLLPRSVLLAASFALVAAACSSGSSGGSTPTLNWYIFHEPSGSFAAAAADCTKSSNGEYRIQIRDLPAAADAQRQQMALRLAAGDSSLDILGLDVTWTPEFAEAGWAAPWPEQLAAKVRAGTLKPMLQTATWEGKLYSAPFNTNTQLLWYRKDLVPTPPKTWAEMLTMAKQFASEGKPHYIEIQGAQYEGFTVWFNTMVRSAGGQILNPDGSQVVLGAPAVTALSVMHDLASSPAADPSLSNQMEDQNRLQFETGLAPFELNYPFVYPSAQTNAPDIFKNMAWAPYPTVKAGEPAHVTIGGIDLAVSALSEHKQQAFDAILCLRGADHEVTNAVNGGLPPVLESVYQDPKFQKLYPFWQTILQELQQASIRPATPAYQSVSLQISYTLSPPSGIDPPSTERTLAGRIQDAIESKGLVP